ncbi:MAG: polyphosphate polymerase domain-containing protein [Firmicutes bacterium]|nr:polyphosphate polymerase domain-containing protein [Bacillota bacterium]
MKTTKRFEFKYIISYVDYFKIIDSLKFLLIHDQHGEKDAYNVTSIYLDDLVFSGASDKAFGNDNHKKYRIRHYNNFSNKNLELKYKSSFETVKYSTTIDEVLYQAIIEGDLNILNQHFENDLVRRFTLDFMLHHLSPTVVIEYQREAYRDEFNNLRITFDHSLFANHFESSKITEMDLKLLESSFLILEIKYESFFPDSIKEIFKKIGLNQIAYSKYFMGYNSLGL